MIDALPQPRNRRYTYLTRPLINNRSFNRVGISRYVSGDRRRIGNPQYIRYGVCWTDENGKRRVKSFQAGKCGDGDYALEVHAAQTAIAFRENWEYCVDRGIRFDPTKYREWRENTLYPFRARRKR